MQSLQVSFYYLELVYKYNDVDISKCDQEHHDLLLAILPAIHSTLEVCRNFLIFCYLACYCVVLALT